MNRFVKLAALLVFLWPALAACASQTTPGGSSPQQPGTSQPSGEPRGVLNVADDLGTERWLLRTATSEMPLWLMSEPLVWWDWEKDKPVNKAILESWDYVVNADKSVDWTFKIRKGVNFQKGFGQVTAEDVKFTFTEFLKKGSVNANTGILTDFFGKDPNNLVVVDDLTLKIHEPEIFNIIELFRVMGPEEPRTLRPFPKKYFEQVGEDGFAKAPVYAGPYEFVSQTPGYEVVLKAVPNFYRTKLGFAEIHYFKVPDEATRSAMLKSGQLDIAAVPGRLVKELESSGLKIAVSQNASEPFIAFGGLYPERPNYDPNYPWTGTDPLGENPVKVRKALNLAIDRKALVDKILFGYGEIGVISFSFINSSMPWWNPDWKPLPYDVPQAKKLLAEAGYPNCFEMNLWLISGQTYTADMGEAAASMWEKNLGCKVNRRLGEYQPTLRTMLLERNTNGWLWAFQGGPIARPQRYACLHGGPSYQVITHTDLKFFTDICSKSDHEVDISKIEQYERQIGDMEYKYFPTVALALVHQTYAVGKKVKSWTPMPKKAGLGLLDYALPS